MSCWKCIPFFGWMTQFLYLVIKSWSSVFYMVHSAGETFQWDFYKTYWSFHFWFHIYLVFLCCFYLFIMFNFCILNCSLGLHLKFVLFKFIQVFIHVLFEYPELLSRFITVLFKFRVLSFTQAILIGNNYGVWWSLKETQSWFLTLLIFLKQELNIWIRLLIAFLWYRFLAYQASIPRQNIGLGHLGES